MRASTFILASLAAVFSIGLASHALAADNAADMIKMEDQMFTPAVQIDVGANGLVFPGGYCSGQVIHSERDKKSGDVETFVLTAKHCTEKVDERMEVVVDDYDKTNHKKVAKHYKAKVWGQSYKSDLALLKLDDKEDVFEKVAKIAPKDVALAFGDPVNLVGYPMGLSKTWTEGRLGYVEDMDGLAFGDISSTGQFYRATPMMVGGSSGSSMFIKDTDGDYKVIGVLTGGAGGYIGLYTPIDEIHEYLDTAAEAWKNNEDILGKKDEKKEEGVVSPTSR